MLMLNQAPQISLTTKVMLSGGTVHLELKNATGKFAAWFYDNKKKAAGDCPR